MYIYFLSTASGRLHCWIVQSGMPRWWGFLSLQTDKYSTHGWYVDTMRICRHLMSLYVGTSVVDHEFFCRLVSRCHCHQHLQSCSVSCKAWRVGVCASYLVVVPNSGLL